MKRELICLASSDFKQRSRSRQSLQDIWAHKLLHTLHVPVTQLLEITLDKMSSLDSSHTASLLSILCYHVLFFVFTFLGSLSVNVLIFSIIKNLNSKTTNRICLHHLLSSGLIQNKHYNNLFSFFFFFFFFEKWSYLTK